MRIFALETDTEKFKKNFLASGEQVLVMVRYHGFRFFITAFWMGILTALIVAAAAGLIYLDASAWMVISGAFVTWLVAVFPRLTVAFIDWKYDFTFVTTDKAVLVDQSSIFRTRVTPINLENFASVSTETQYMNLFSFGKLVFHLKSGIGTDMVLPYTLNAGQVAAQIANIVTEYQRRKDLRRYHDSDENDLPHF
ncbi:hypothetical protein A3A67_02920 [Candidatus Peribacteria bacterium RIFCSPLOWO2_01_FULL_51_18]|nr:MAG: hypothetical protein A3C52_00780 [Candidatus Peribacteria bacterium RIFCSPHIGHO2_02_FULL_51_15]OGJ65999.1 MAG: hypothetical protein A3A67_02920 [Candidatus Peribacteria bacterium RIFCSPLOWO2_01_FULL_51_18]OGJ68118.1 MAG: hypothetical protein A3J34_01415 [Candidatus Peribacteria bacterium RIFCSPLOWO2_02_FULL_51_10]